MTAVEDRTLTTSFVKLRRLAVSFDHLDDGRPAAAEERAILRVVTQLGATALRLLLRELASRPAGGDDRARWAHSLLAHLGRSEALRARIVDELGILVRSIGAGDHAKLRSLTLLAELGADLPASAQLDDPDAARRRSLHELALCLGTPAEVARAGDHLLEELPFDDILGLFDDLVTSEPGSAMLLIDELLVRDELDEVCRRELRQRRAAARQTTEPPRSRPAATRRGPAPPRTRFARHEDGRRILLATARQSGSRPPRHRLLCVLVGGEGVLLDGYHAEDLPAAEVDQRFVAPLAEQGFRFAPTSLAAARGFVIQAARRAVQLGRTLPRAFYLGRDIIGVRDEHLDGTSRSRGEPGGADVAVLLDRGIELIATGEPAQARPLLELYVAEVPDDPHGHAQLGICQLGLGDAAGALHHLGRATWLDPDEPLHHWNSAAAAAAAGKRGACYLSLQAYLDSDDTDPGADDRHQAAQRFIGEFERLAHLEYPGISPKKLAAADLDPSERPRRSRRRRRAKN